MSNIDELRERLRKLVSSSVRRGEFKLASGRISDFYIDGKETTLTGEGAYLTGRVILHMLRDCPVDAVGGMTLGADPIVSVVAAMAHQEGRKINAFIVRKTPKTHGTQKWIEGPPFPPNARIVVLEDVVTTGATLLETIDRIKSERPCEIVKVICLVDRLEGGKENLAAAGYQLQPIFLRTDLL